VLLHFKAMRMDVAVVQWILQSTAVEQVDLADRYSIAQSFHCLSHSKQGYLRPFGLCKDAHEAAGD
jgi:hypothetical protein